jgi:hypothetical protein
LSPGVEMTEYQQAIANEHDVLSASRLTILLVGLVIFAISTNEYQIFYQIHASTGTDLIEVSRGVLDGHPPWRAFQARLLGPFSFAVFEALTAWIRGVSPQVYSAFERVFSQPDTRDLAALDGFVAGMIVAKNFFCLVLLTRYSRSIMKAAAGTILGSLLFVLLSHQWLYMWDLFELIFFCYLAYAMFNGKKLTVVFFLVYLLALANRESAAFFGVWLLCRVAANWLCDGRIKWGEAFGGVAMVGVAVVYVLVLRQTLLVESTFGHEVGGTWGNMPIQAENHEIHQAFGNHLLVLENAVTFVKNLASTHFYVDAYVVALAWHAWILGWCGLRRRDPQLTAIGMFNLLLLGCVLNFALINETRLFLICVPFVVFSVVTFGNEIISFLARFDYRLSMDRPGG